MNLLPRDGTEGEAPTPPLPLLDVRETPTLCPPLNLGPINNAQLGGPLAAAANDISARI